MTIKRKPCRLPEQVLIVTPHYPPRWIGGTEVHAQKLALWLKDQGVVVEVICIESLSKGTEDRLWVQEDKQEGICVHRLHLSHVRPLPGSQYEFDNSEIEQYIDRVIVERSITMVHLISGYLVTACAIRAAHRRGVPAVVTLSDYWFVCARINLIRSNNQMCDGPHNTLDCTRCILGESRRYAMLDKVWPSLGDLVWKIIERTPVRKHIRLNKQLSRRQETLIQLLNSADAVTIPTNSLRGRLVRAGVKEHKLTLSRHGLDTRTLGIVPTAPAQPSKALRFGYMGQIAFTKGVDLLVRAFLDLAEEYTQIALDIWGDENKHQVYVDGLKRMAEGNQRVSFHGRYEPGQLQQILSEIDVLVVPSRCREIGPIVILEAYYFRTPVIAARLGNMSELVQHDQNGLLFTANSLESLHEQMERCVVDSELQQRLVNRISRVRTAEEEMLDLERIYFAVSVRG